MQGCAGVFPALLIVYVANTSGTPIDISLIIMSIIVITIGSIGIAGIPGTSTMAAQSVCPVLALEHPLLS